MESVAKSVCLTFLYHHKETTINKFYDSDVFKTDIFAYSHYISLIYFFFILVGKPCELTYGFFINIRGFIPTIVEGIAIVCIASVCADCNAALIVLEQITIRPNVQVKTLPLNLIIRFIQKSATPAEPLHICRG